MNNVGLTNQLFLAGYLQGFTAQCVRLVRQQLKHSARVDCICARMCDVPTFINLARLERARCNLAGLLEALAGLEETVRLLERATAGDVPPEIAEPLFGGAIFKDVQFVREGELAKYWWMIGDVAACLGQLGLCSSNSSSALELRLRCLLRSGKPDQVLTLCLQNAERHGWVLDYAAIALLRGGLEEEALELARRLTGHFPLPRLRLILELLEGGHLDDAVLAVDALAATAAATDEEPTLLIAAALLSEAKVGLPPTLQSVGAVASRSRHFPPVFLAAAALGLKVERQRLPSARSELDAIAARFRAEIARHAA